MVERNIDKPITREHSPAPTLIDMKEVWGERTTLSKPTTAQPDSLPKLQLTADSQTPTNRGLRPVALPEPIPQKPDTGATQKPSGDGNNYPHQGDSPAAPQPDTHRPAADGATNPVTRGLAPAGDVPAAPPADNGGTHQTSSDHGSAPYYPHPNNSPSGLNPGVHRPAGDGAQVPNTRGL